MEDCNLPNGVVSWMGNGRGDYQIDCSVIRNCRGRLAKLEQMPQGGEARKMEAGRPRLAVDSGRRRQVKCRLFKVDPNAPHW